jgi:phosphate butyryltransferase
MRVLFAAAYDVHTLEGIDKAFIKGIIEPVLIGDGEKIRGIIKSEGLSIDGTEIIEAADDAELAKTAARLIVEGKVGVIMKGKLQTADLLREVVNKEYGLRTGNIMSPM